MIIDSLKTNAIDNNAVLLVLAQPYTRSVILQEDGTYLAEIVEFPGCIAVGFSLEEAYNNLERVAESWIEAVLDAGQSIPKLLST